MSVRPTPDAIVLEGRCGAQDAELLLLALQDRPGAVVDVTGIRNLHMAVAQILLALRPVLRGQSEVPFLKRNIFAPLISDSDIGAENA